jgi:hypothetical protein
MEDVDMLVQDATLCLFRCLQPEHLFAPYELSSVPTILKAIASL